MRGRTLAPARSPSSGCEDPGRGRWRQGIFLVGEEDVHRGEAPSSVIAAELSMNDQNLVEELRGALERSVQITAVALRQHVEVVAGCQDYHPPLIRSVVEEKHVSLPEGAAVFGIKVELSKGERGSWTGVKSPPGSLSNLLQGFFARKEGKGIRRQGSSYSREDLVVAGSGGGSNILDFGTCFCSVGVSWFSRMSVEFSYAVEGVIDCVEASRALVVFDTPPGLSSVYCQPKVFRLLSSGIQHGGEPWSSASSLGCRTPFQFQKEKEEEG